MKRRIKVSTPDGKSITKEFNTRNYDQYKTLLKYKSRRFRDKTKYTRKEKYKKGISDDSFYFFNSLKNH